VIELWHYTCEHAWAKIGARGELVPAAELMRNRVAAELIPTARWVWLTDLAVPIPAALGLTRQLAKCDRIAHRYRVLGGVAVPYVTVRRELPRAWRDELETAPGARLMHWWISAGPVPVEIADLDGARVTA
jgi:hypothetical protein